MAEPYIFDYGAKWFIGLGLTRITINTANGKVYPTPSGKVSKDVEEACKRLCGTTKTISEIVALLKPTLTKDYQK